MPRDPSALCMVQALEKVEEQHEWKARFLVSLALSQQDSGKAEEAGKTLAKAMDIADKQRLAIKVGKGGNWHGRPH